MSGRFLHATELTAYLEERAQRPSSDGGRVSVPLSLAELGGPRIAVEWGELLGVACDPHLAVPPARRDAAAAAISAANGRQRLVGFRIQGDRIVFSLAAFLEEDGSVSSLVLDRLIVITRLAVEASLPAIRAAVLEPSAAPPALLEAVLRDRPILASLLARPFELVERSQPWFRTRRIVEARTAAGLLLHAAVDEAGTVQVLTGRPEVVNDLALAEDLAARLADDAVALAYVLDATFWTRSDLDEKRPAEPQPWIRLHKAGREVGFEVVVDGQRRLARVLLDEDGRIVSLEP